MSEVLTPKRVLLPDLAPARSRLALPRWRHVALLAILALSAFLGVYRLDQEGWANQYYAATVKSMLTSWSNFFFAAFDPGGYVTVDKPPLGFWIQAASAKLFGFSNLSLLLPQVVAAVLSVALLYHLVRRRFGVWAGLIAALALAVTPISVVTSRNNTIDSLLVLCVLAAAWAVLRAAETGRLRWLLLGAVLVGLGFNIKMLEAYLVVPALWLLYLVAPKPRWWWRILQLGLATMVLLAVSLAWVVTVDLIPADQRPYVGSSQENSELELAIGYNGVNRLLRNQGPFAGRDSNAATRAERSDQATPDAGGSAETPSNAAGATPSSANAAAGNPAGGANGRQAGSGAAPGGSPNAGRPGTSATSANPGQAGAGAAPNSNAQQGAPPAAGTPDPGQPGVDGNAQGAPGTGQTPPDAGAVPGGAPGGQGGAFAGGPGGAGETGEVGVFRLFSDQLGGQVSWLLPLAILGCFVAFAQTRPHWRFLPFDTPQQSLALWGMWLLTQAIFFSVAGFFHRYYMVMMAPAIAALVGSGVVALWKAYRGSQWFWWLLPAGLVGVAAVQVYLLRDYRDWNWWLNPLILGVGIGAAVVLVVARLWSWLRPEALRQAVGGGRWLAISGGVGVLMVAPLLWGAIPVWNTGSGGMGNALPAAGPGGAANGFRLPAGGIPADLAPYLPQLAGNDGQQPAGGNAGRNGRGQNGNAGNRFGGPGELGGANSALIDYLKANQGQTKFLVATTSANQAAPIILETGLPVMAIGGFSGSDPILTQERLAELVQNGTVRFFLLQGGGAGGFGPPGRAGQQNAIGWVTTSCSVVPSDRYQTNASGAQANQNLGVQLYDCAGAKA